MKKIGFVDYYISEWHANNYPLWIAEECKKNGLSYEVAYAWAEEYVSPVDGRNTDEWCREFGVEKCNSIDELCEKSDFIIILAPSNPEKHLAYTKEVFKYGKPTYVDKTFAPDYKTAKEIFAISEKYGTPFFSTSALRYATETDAYEWDKEERIITTGGGSNLAEYIIHQIEMIVKAMGSGEKVKYVKIGPTTFLNVQYKDGREAVMTYSSGVDFTVRNCFEVEWTEIKSPFFNYLIADILRFFESGIPSFDVKETLEVMKLREASLKASESPETWVYLDSI
jgi:hypothetical protein